MNAQDPQKTELLITTVLSKNPKLDLLQTTLLNQFLQNKLQMYEFLYFCIVNSLFMETNTIALVLIYLKCAFEAGLFKYIIELTEILQKSEIKSYKMAMSQFFIDPKLPNLMTLEVQEIESFLNKFHLNKTISNLDQLISSEVAKLAKFGPNLPISEIYVFKNEENKNKLFENYTEIAEILNQIKTSNLLECSYYQPDFLLPIPSEISIEIDEFLTPFPFIIEAPILNSHLPYTQIANEMVKNHAKLTPNEEEAR